MKLDKSHYHTLIHWAAMSTLLLLLAGCQSSPPDYTPEPDNEVRPSAGSNGPQQSYSEEVDKDDTEPNYGKQAEDIDGRSSAEASSAGMTKSETAKIWNEQDPSLGGIKIGAAIKALEDQVGQALDTYVLESDKEHMTVYEYAGFSVGLGKEDAVKLVEIYDGEVVSGLNGLKVGDPRETAIKLLGQPGSQSVYLLTYDAEGASLRLDVDPASNEIVSIKLLATG